MLYEICISFFKKDDLCSLDDELIRSLNLILTNENFKKCANEIIEILEKYK